MTMIPRPRPRYNTPEEIYEAVCPDCKQPLEINFLHVGGHSCRQPHLVCPNEACQTYLVWRLTDEQYEEYTAYVLDRELANRAWSERLDEDFFCKYFGEVA